MFADGQVQIVEFDVPREARREGVADEVVGKELREARIPADSKVASIIRGERMIFPSGAESILPADRVVVIGSPDAARTWSEIMSPGERRVEEVVVFGAGQTGTAIARILLDQGIRVRLVEPHETRAREVAEELHDARVYQASGIDSDFLERERIGQANAAVFAMREDAKNLYAATLARVHGVGFTIGIVHEPISLQVFERAGIDVAVNPRSVTAEEIVRFAHDPRFASSPCSRGTASRSSTSRFGRRADLVARPFKELPITGSLIGAIVRDGDVIFPHGDDMLEPGDRAIIFTESSRVPEVEKAL